MSSIVTDQGILHFEVIGRGRPLILLHGWINSWDVWRNAMLAVTGRGGYRLYALDFWGFGDSAKPAHDGGSAFRLSSYVEMVRGFMDNLGISSAPLAGHSMGGTVALQFALAYPERVSKVIVVGSPVYGRSLNPMLQLAGYGWSAWVAWRVPAIREGIMRAILAGDSRPVRQMIFRDVQRTTLQSFFRSIGDLRDTDLRGKLQRLNQPALGIYGANDNIVSPKNGPILAREAGRARLAVMHQSRHFPMSDEPEKFVETLSTFLLNGH
ncbi:MAG: alpha/beta fold hydrolase [Candidatus Promineifilaceae bacterium]